MKIRAGFVSNSSSSSFVCDVTGATESGYDASARYCGMVQCVNGHTFIIDLFVGEGLDELGEWDECAEENCPICTMKEVSTDMLIAYLMKGRYRAEVTDEIRKKYDGNNAKFEAEMRQRRK